MTQKIQTKKEKIRKSLKYSILDGTFYSMMVGFGESFFSAFAVFLKATNFHLGLLGSLPQALGSLSELLSNKLIKIFNSRKKAVCFFAFVEGLLYIPIALVFFLGTLKIGYLIFFVCLYWVFGMVLGPAWNSWMGDLVAEKERGTYFGKRNKITGFASFISLLLGGYILQQFGGSPTKQYIGFIVIFSLAFIARIFSFSYLLRQYEPKYTLALEAEFSFIDFIKQARFRNFGLFVIYLCFTNLTVYLSAPFFTAYMLYDLRLDYMTFTIVNATAVIIKLISMPSWGRASDRFGTKRILGLSAVLVSFVPLFWFFARDITYLIIIQIYGGFVSAGFEIASFNFIFDATSSQKRALCVAYYNVLNGFAIVIGAILGSLIVKYNTLFWSKYLLVFLVSFIFRYLISVIFIPKLREVRQVEQVPYRKIFFNLISEMPTMGIVHKLVTFKKKR